MFDVDTRPVEVGFEVVVAADESEVGRFTSYSVFHKASGVLLKRIEDGSHVFGVVRSA